ncbi:hypothetical protein U1Q18_020972 [Sarracenia purpurea var. burkii]
MFETIGENEMENQIWEQSREEFQSDQESGDPKRSDIGEENDDDLGHDQHGQDFSIREHPTKEDEKLIGRPKKVKEEPGSEKAEEN